VAHTSYTRIQQDGSEEAETDTKAIVGDPAAARMHEGGQSPHDADTSRTTQQCRGRRGRGQIREGRVDGAARRRRDDHSEMRLVAEFPAPDFADADSDSSPRYAFVCETAARAVSDGLRVCGCVGEETLVWPACERMDGRRWTLGGEGSVTLAAGAGVGAGGERALATTVPLKLPRDGGSSLGAGDFSAAGDWIGLAVCGACMSKPGRLRTRGGSTAATEEGTAATAVGEPTDGPELRKCGLAEDEVAPGVMRAVPAGEGAALDDPFNGDERSRLTLFGEASSRGVAAGEPVVTVSFFPPMMLGRGDAFREFAFEPRGVDFALPGLRYGLSAGSLFFVPLGSRIRFGGAGLCSGFGRIVAGSWTRFFAEGWTIVPGPFEEEPPG
jgi:hypothetical protein